MKLSSSNTPFYSCLESDEEMASYFSSLPKAVQSTIVHCSGDIKTVGDLKKVAEGLMEN